MVVMPPPCTFLAQPPRLDQTSPEGRAERLRTQLSSIPVTQPVPYPNPPLRGAHSSRRPHCLQRRPPGSLLLGASWGRDRGPQHGEWLPKVSRGSAGGLTRSHAPGGTLRERAPAAARMGARVGATARRWCGSPGPAGLITWAAPPWTRRGLRRGAAWSRQEPPPPPLPGPPCAPPPARRPAAALLGARDCAPPCARPAGRGARRPNRRCAGLQEARTRARRCWDARQGGGRGQGVQALGACAAPCTPARGPGPCGPAEAAVRETQGPHLRLSGLCPSSPPPLRVSSNSDTWTPAPASSAPASPFRSIPPVQVAEAA